MHTRIAVLVSGDPFKLEALVKDRLKVALVLADRSSAEVAQVAANWELETVVLPRAGFSAGKEFNLLDQQLEKINYTRLVRQTLRSREIDLVVLADFDTALTPELFGAGSYGGRIVTTHSSLLPMFRTANPVREALAARVRITGTTVYLASDEPATGTILAQQPVAVCPADTEALLRERIREVERKLLPQMVREFAEVHRPRLAEA